MATKKTEAQIEFKAVTSEFSNGIKDMNSDLKTLGNELKLNATQLKGNANDVNLLKERQTLLQKELQASTQKVELTNNSLLEAERLLGKNSTEYKNLYNQLISAKNQQQAIQNEINETTNKIKQQDNSLDDAEKSWKELDNALDDVNDGFTITKGVLADLTSSGIQSVVNGIGNITSSIYETVDATEEYRSMMAKLEGSTNSFGYSVEFSTEKFDMFYKYLGDNQMATNAITNLMGLQTSQESLTALTEASIGVWSAYGDSIPIESLTESINETAQVGKVTGVMADALNWAGMSEDDFNAKLEKTNSTQERAELIAKTLNGVYGESKKTYDELSVGILNANEKENEFQKSQAEMGKTIAPLKDKMTELKTKGFKALQPVVEKVIDGFLKFTDWCSKNKGLLEGIAIVIGSIATATLLVNGAVGAYNIIMPIYTAITTGASLSTTALGTAIAFLTSPITIAILAIGALIVVGVLLWKNWDKVKEFGIACWEGIKNTWNAAGEWFNNTIVAPITNFFSDMWNGLKDGAGQTWEGIKNIFSNVTGWFREQFTNAWTAVKNVFSTGGKIFDGIKDGIVNAFKTIVNGIISGINRVISIPFNKINDVLTSIRNFDIPVVGRVFSWLPSISVPQIPQLAEGNVATKPTLALFGEYANAISNPEITTPENKMHDVFYATLDEYANKKLAYTEQNNGLIEAIENLKFYFYVDSQQMAQATANANDQVSGTRVSLRGRGVSLA